MEALGGGLQLLVSAPDFVANAPAEIEWIVEGVIERGANGFFVAAPKEVRVGRPLTWLSRWPLVVRGSGFRCLNQCDVP